MIDALFDIVKMIGDFLSSIISGLKALVEALFVIQGINQTASIWMPSFVFGIFSIGVILMIVLRIVK